MSISVPESVISDFNGRKVMYPKTKIIQCYDVKIFF